jgi:signal transduction histidine kinase
MLRIVRELVVNAIRHGHARHIRICGETQGGETRILIEDDGCGFDPATRPGFRDGHFGLHGIAERVDRIDGDIFIESAPGKGTKVSVSLPSPDQSNHS